MNVWYFLVWVGMRGNLFAHLSRVVIEGSHGVGKRVNRQDRVLNTVKCEYTVHLNIIPYT